MIGGCSKPGRIMVAVCAIFEKVNFKIRQSNKNRMMTFTITDFLISLPITAIIIFAIKLVYKRAGISATPMGCLIGCLIMFWFVLCAIGGCSERKRTQSESHLAHIKLVTTGTIVKIPKSELVGADTIYREKKHVYKNDTGRDLVEYMVKYTTNGQDAGSSSI